MNCKICDYKISDAQYALLMEKVYKSCPGCSTVAEEHIFYACPDRFGVTNARITQNNPMGLQSHCGKCRANNKGPHEGYVTCEQIANAGGFLIPEIRFLPMSSDIFPTYEDAKEFIYNVLPKRNGLYYFGKSRMQCEQESFTLFQYGGRLIGYAIFDYIKMLPKPVLEEGFTYEGYYRFYPESIQVIDSPITSSQYKKIDNGFKGFNQSHQKRPVGLLPAIWTLLDGNTSSKWDELEVTIPEEIDADDNETLLEGQKKQITVNAYERNSEARKRCLAYYKKINHGKIKCEVCNFDFGNFYGEEFAGKIHVHHIKEISSIGKEYVIDAEKDLIPICPNCHMVVHSRKPAISIEEVKAMLRK